MVKKAYPEDLIRLKLSAHIKMTVSEKQQSDEVTP